MAASWARSLPPWRRRPWPWGLKGNWPSPEAGHDQPLAGRHGFALPGLRASTRGSSGRCDFSPDRGSLLAVAGLGSGVEVWDVASGTLAAALKTPDVVQDLGFAPDGPSGDRLLVAASGGVGLGLGGRRARGPNPGLRVERPLDPGLRPRQRAGPGIAHRRQRLGSPALEHRPLSDDDPDLGRTQSSTVEFDDQGRLGVIDARIDPLVPPPEREPVSRVELPQLPKPNSGPDLEGSSRRSPGRPTAGPWFWPAPRNFSCRARPIPTRSARSSSRTTKGPGRPVLDLPRDLIFAPAAASPPLSGRVRPPHPCLGDRGRPRPRAGLDRSGCRGRPVGTRDGPWCSARRGRARPGRSSR